MTHLNCPVCNRPMQIVPVNGDFHWTCQPCAITPTVTTTTTMTYEHNGYLWTVERSPQTCVKSMAPIRRPPDLEPVYQWWEQSFAVQLEGLAERVKARKRATIACIRAHW